MRLASEEVVAEGVGASDVEQGFDGSIYICDFGGGWSVNANGAIHELSPKDATLQNAAAELASVSSADLVRLMTSWSHSSKRCIAGSSFASNGAV